MSILTYALKIKIRRTPKVRRIPRKSCLLLHPRSDDGHLIDLLGVAAPGEVVDGGVEALEDGAVGLIAAQALGDLVADAAGLNVGEDEGVSVAGHLKTRPGASCSGPCCSENSNPHPGQDSEQQAGEGGTQEIVCADSAAGRFGLLRVPGLPGSADGPVQVGEYRQNHQNHADIIAQIHTVHFPAPSTQSC